MKKGYRTEIGELRIFSCIVAVLVGIFSVLYLFDIVQNGLLLNMILFLGILLNFVLAAILFLKKRRVAVLLTMILTVGYGAALVWMNI